MPQLIINQCQNRYRKKTWKQSCIFIYKKPRKVIVNAIVFEQLEGCVRERINYQKESKRIPEAAQQMIKQQSKHSSEAKYGAPNGRKGGRISRRGVQFAARRDPSMK